jgi:hypothetical protein
VLRLRVIVLVCLLGCAGTRPSTSPAPVSGGASVMPDKSTKGSPLTAADSGKKSSYEPFADLVAGALERRGFFDTYEKDDHLYLAVPKARLGHEFLLTTEIAQGIGTRGLIGGTMLNIFEGSIVVLERHGDRIFLLQRPHRFTAPGTAASQAVALSFGSSVLAGGRIESFRDDSAAVVDIAEWIVSDLSNVGLAIRGVVAPDSTSQVKATFDRDRSYLESVKAFPRNLNLRAKLTFTPTDSLTLNSVPDSRYIPVSVFYSFAALPETLMSPRRADDRVGYFITAQKDYSADDTTFFRRYVNRWRLEPGARAGELYQPVKPIVYYLDRTIPDVYRPYVKAGVEAWNRAFEAAGFTHAIRAEPLPDSADAEDIRYPTIRWVTSDEPVYGAIGPSVVDPRTGEILDADILVEASIVQGFKRQWRSLVRPAAALDAMLGTQQTGSSRGLESPGFAAGLAAQGGLLRAILADRGVIGPTDPVPEAFVGQALAWVTMHEVGHTLGLRHNFRSSTDTPLDKLHDRTWADANGLTGSVMEYPSVNVTAAALDPGYYYTPGIGSYDRWAIAYGYTPAEERAAALAREVARTGHAYGTDEDAFGPGALDPTVNIWDLGNDPLAWARERGAIISGLWPRLADRLLADNSRYSELTDAFQALLGQYAQTLGIAVKYIGGQYQYRDHQGDPEGRPPFRPVPKTTQRAALELLETRAFGEEAFAVPREVLARFGANRWAHWGEQEDFDGRIDYPLHEQVLETQTTLLRRALHPLLFSRIRDAEVKFGPAEVLTVAELLDGLTASVWSELWSGPGRRVSAMRRDLQRADLDQMTALVIGSVPRLPADARAAARYELVELRRRLEARRNARGLDAATRAHLAESSARIGKVLEAQLSDTP